MRQHFIPLSIFCILLCTQLVFAETESRELIANREITLLAVSQDGSDLSGSTATLTLEVVQGSGRIFLDTQPLAKFDTQLSTRLAQQIACSVADVDCTNYDFIYTIQSSAPIIGGPSAGAAIAGITVAALKGYMVDDQVALTGTMNSGGIVGPVGGVIPKVKAAGRAGLDKVLIPKGERFNKEQLGNTSSNQTNNIDAFVVGKESGIQVSEVADIYEIVEHITGNDIRPPLQEIQLPEFYESTMQKVADQMCQRAEKLENQIRADINVTINVTRIRSNAESLVAQAENATRLGNTYSAASYCFGAAIRYQTILIHALPEQEVDQGLIVLQRQLNAYEVPEPTTLTDIQTYMLVNERLRETQQLIDQARGNLQNNQSTRAKDNYAYAIQRFESAKSWSIFFDKPGTDLKIDELTLAQTCTLRLDQAEQRRQYLGIYIPTYTESRVDDLNTAYDEQDDKDYALCIFYAGKAKANYDVLIGSLSLSDEEKTQNQIEIRQVAAQREIAKQTQYNAYPIISFSFLDYSESLQENDPYSSLLYAQYALELADVTPYLNKQQGSAVQSIINTDITTDTLIGVVIGILGASVIFGIERRFILGKTHSNPGKLGMSRKKR